MKPSTPTIKGIIKIYKTNLPLSHVVNWRNAPAYNLAKVFTQKIRQLAPLPNTYNIENTRETIGNLQNTPILPHFKFASLDITKLYTNILVSENRHILSNMLEQNFLKPKKKHELVNLYDTITSQNYFTYIGNILI